MHVTAFDTDSPALARRWTLLSLSQRVASSAEPETRSCAEYATLPRLRPATIAREAPEQGVDDRLADAL
jgi:hypothetical protein